MPSDQELADAVEGVLRGDVRCDVCGRWMKHVKFTDFGVLSASICDKCWREVSIEDVQLVIPD